MAQEKLNVQVPNLLYDKNYLQYLIENERDGFRDVYVEQTFPEESWNYQKKLMSEFPYFANKILDDFEMSNGEKQDLYMKNLVYEDKGGGRIVLISGARGGGKTATGCFTLHEFHERRPDLKFFFVSKKANKPKLPDWIKMVEAIKDVPNNSIALIDEGAIQLSSRRSNTRHNVDASDELVVLRHRGITLIILVQNAKMIDINVRRLADVMVLKYGVANEETGSDDEEMLRRRLRPKNVSETYIEIPSKQIYIKFTHGLPEWFDSIATSKSFRDIKINEKPAIAEGGIMGEIKSFLKK